MRGGHSTNRTATRSSFKNVSLCYLFCICGGGGGWQCRIHYTSGLNPLSLFRTQYSCGPSISTVYWALSWWITWSAASSLDSTLCPGRTWGPIAKDGPVCTSPLSPHQPRPCYHISFRCLEATRQVHSPVGVLLDFSVMFTLHYTPVLFLLETVWDGLKLSWISSYLWLLFLRAGVMFSPLWGTLRNQTRIIETDHWVKALVTNPTNLTSVPRTHAVSRENWLPLSSDLHTHTRTGTRDYTQ